MNIEIKKLVPELSEDYLGFFDTTPHDDEKDDYKCYCVCWSSADHNGVDDSSNEKRRDLAKKYVKDGSLCGYLAYEKGKVVGWCNANTKYDCLKSRCGRMYFGKRDSDEIKDGLKIKSVFCFVIAPEMRRKGLSGLLLEKVCEDAEKEGFDFVEAYPLKEFTSTQYDYMGPFRIYERRGFTPCFDYGDRYVVRKRLK